MIPFGNYVLPYQHNWELSNGSEMIYQRIDEKGIVQQALLDLHERGENCKFRRLYQT